MLNKYEIEFSKLFKRLMNLEVTIRERILYSSEKIYKNNNYNELKKFFINPYIYEQYDTKNKGNRILTIVKDKKVSSNEKLTKLINTLYISHLLSFSLKFKQFYQNKEILDLFYYIKPENSVEFKALRKKSALIKNLRNDVVHFNFECFEKNKKEYLEALCLFEIHMGCSICKLHLIKNLKDRLPITEILSVLQDEYPEFFEKDNSEYLNYNRDRILLELFDDLAILNGYEYNELPSPWSILRQKYELSLSKNGFRS